MNHTTTLHGMTVLITRPQKQADALSEAIQAHQGRVIRHPTLLIESITDIASAQEVIKQLDTMNSAIFVSANAVNYAQTLLPKNWPVQVKPFAIGAATAQQLEKNNIVGANYPEQANSEGLLALPELQQIKGQRILLFRGQGGRELLAKTLQQRGAEIFHAVIYQRKKPRAISAEQLTQWQTCENLVIVSTSCESLENLWDMVGLSERTWLAQQKLVVVGERMLALAKKIGFRGANINSVDKANESTLLLGLLAIQG